jgi:putative ABC transport system substrate-binding protein
MKEPGDLENAFGIAGKETDGLIVVGAAWLNSHRTQIIDLAGKTRLPIMYTQRQFVVEGGLMSYSADLFEQARHAAIYVDRILEGSKPADLPVEQPTKFELMI